MKILWAPLDFTDSQTQLRDFSGRLLPLRFVSAPSENRCTIDASELTSGFYVIQITDGLIMRSSRVVIR